MKKFLTRYSYRYPAVIVYMLQASEYYLRDFLKWYHGTADFGAVERAGKLKLTAKARLLLVISWLAILAYVIKIVLFSLVIPNLIWNPVPGIAVDLLVVLLLLLIPYLLPYFMIIPVLLINYFVQKPLEFIVARKLRATIAAHPGTRIAIAGSYGKTTMREILRDVLSAGKRVSAPGGSFNTLWGISKFVKSLKGDEEILIFELGEYYPGDVARLCRFVQPDVGFVTGINEAHLDRMRTLERTTATIYELADSLGDKPLYINGENKLARDAARGNNKLYFTSGCGGLKVTSATTGLTGTDLIVQRDKDELKLHSDLLGLHLVGSLAAAAELAFELGLTKSEITKGIAQTKPFARRLQLLSEVGGVVTLDDSYNGNPDGVQAVIDFLSELKGHRRFYITSGLVEMGDRSKAVHEKIGEELAAAGIEKIFLIRNSATPYIAEGLETAGYSGDITWYESSTQAYEAVGLSTVKGDVVLLQTDWPDQYK